MDKNNVRTVKDLKVWQKSIELVELIYKITERYPSNEQYGLVSQMRRAAVSVPSNIAEGYRRQYRKEYKQFLSVALGSCSELETQLEISKRLGFLKDNDLSAVSELLNYVCAMLVKLNKCL